MFKSGFVTIIGEPNVGKSTFLNQVLKQKIAITSRKPQTTRNVFSGIYNDDESQIIFMDTPGIHVGKTKLSRYISSAAIATVKTVDLVLYMVNAYDDVKSYNLDILKEIKGIKTPVFLIINKLDTISDFKRLEETIDVYKKAYPFKGVFGISALMGDHIDLLLRDIKNVLEPGPKYYPDGEISDRPETFIIQEFIREKILEYTHQEVPHSVMVYLETYKQKKNVSEIHATIVVERKSQKGIVIGKNGSMLKRIGTAARKDIQDFLKRKIYLELFCKVEEDWRNREYYLKNFGYKESR
jgi:GTP-binding protein Era